MPGDPTFVGGTYVEPVEAGILKSSPNASSTRKIVHDAVDALPPNYWTVITQRDIEELSTSKTAAIPGFSEGRRTRAAASCPTGPFIDLVRDDESLDLPEDLVRRAISFDAPLPRLDAS